LPSLAPADLDGLPCSLRATERPLGHGAVTADPVAVVAVVDVGNAVEPRLDPFPDLLPAYQPKKDMIASTSWALNASRKA
jgi:hypothetical protein